MVELWAAERPFAIDLVLLCLRGMVVVQEDWAVDYRVACECLVWYSDWRWLGSAQSLSLSGVGLLHVRQGCY